MQEIAQDAGVAVGTLYLYFKNKDDLVVACAGEFAERHRREIEQVLAADLPADDKLRRYVMSRFRASESIRTGSRHAVELTRAVLRLKPDRVIEEGMMMMETVAQIVRQGIEERRFVVESVEDDAKVFLLSIAYFFPNALNEPQMPLVEEDLVLVIEFFVRAWTTRRHSATKKSARIRRSRA